MSLKFLYKTLLTIIVLLVLRQWLLHDGSSFMLFAYHMNQQSYPDQSLTNTVVVNKDITIRNYFQFMDSVVQKYDSITPYSLTEHLLVRTNPWIIDTLKNTDYYIMKARDSFVYDQGNMIALPENALLRIPDASAARKMSNSFHHTTIDINIPEFKLRINVDSIELHQFSIRVGRDEEKFLKMSGRIQDLKTKTGHGHIIGHVRNPRYVNPVNNHEYFVTKRDDDKVTKLPQIPFIEVELNGLRHGQLIHPTTNPITLGKAYSNGCIGTKESDAWVIYYYTPVNTKVTIRYDLVVSDNSGNEQRLLDIYGYGSDSN